MKYEYMAFSKCFYAFTMKTRKGMIMSRRKYEMMRLLERGRLIPYCLCWYSREIFVGGVGKVVVNLMRTRPELLWSSKLHTNSIHPT